MPAYAEQSVSHFVQNTTQMGGVFSMIESITHARKNNTQMGGVVSMIENITQIVWIISTPSNKYQAECSEQ